MKLSFALFFVALMTVVFGNPLAEDFTVAIKDEGDLQLNDDADDVHDDDAVTELTDDDDEYLEDDDDDDDDVNNDSENDPLRGGKKKTNKRKKRCGNKKVKKCMKNYYPSKCLKSFIRKCKPKKVDCINELSSCLGKMRPSKMTLKKCRIMYKDCRKGGPGSGMGL